MCAAVGNGFPLGVVITTRAIANSFNNGMEYFNTFGGNPVAAAVGLAVLKVLDDERLMENARTVGQYLISQLTLLKDDFLCIGDVCLCGDPSSRQFVCVNVFSLSC